MQRVSSASRPSTAGRSRAPRPAETLTPRGTSSSAMIAGAENQLALARCVPAAPRATPPPVSSAPTFADASTVTEPMVDAQRAAHMRNVEELLRRVKLGDVTERPSPSFHTIVHSRQKLLDELAELRQHFAEQHTELLAAKRTIQERTREINSLQLRMKLDGASRSTGTTAVFIDVSGIGSGGPSPMSSELFGGRCTIDADGSAQALTCAIQRSLHADGRSRCAPSSFATGAAPRATRSVLQDDTVLQSVMPTAAVSDAGLGLEKVKEQWRVQQQREVEHQQQSMPMAFIEETPAWKAQLQIIASLEAENTILRRQRDEQLAHAQKEHERLLQEVEEARDKLEEGSAHWSEKQKELNRLRVLMRFSQLKRDSDKLQETYKRVDELENLLRRSHQNDQRSAIDRDDLKRLKLLEIHTAAVFDGVAPVSSIPPHLLRRTHQSSVVSSQAAAAPAASVPARSAVVRPSTAKLSRPSTPSSIPTEPQTGGSSGKVPDSSISSGAPLRSASTGPSAPAAQENETVVARSEPTAAGLPEQPPPAAPASDADVSFSTITERMQQYLERRKRQKEEAVLAEKQQQQQLQAAAEFANNRKLVRPSSGHSDTRRTSLLVRPGSAGTRSLSSGVAYEGPSLGPPKSFAYIGGRMIPIHSR
jgi:hypothetical protein